MQSVKKNIWIFGGTGFIGSVLVKHLLRDKKNLLHLLVHKRVDYRSLENFNIVTGSLSGFDPFWFERYPPDILFHLARPAGSNMFTRIRRAASGGKANRRLVNILRRLPCPPVIVYVSGSLMYGERCACDPAKENDPLNPASFARFYYYNERPWIDAQKDGRLDVRFARPGWIAGPGSWFREFFWKPYLRSGKVPCYGEGNQPMSLIHIEDCAAMIEVLGSHGKKGINLNIFSGDIIRHVDFCQILARLLKTETEVIPYERIRRKFGKVTASALVSSTPLQTQYPDLHRKSNTLYPHLEESLTDVIRLLENV